MISGQGSTESWWPFCGKTLSVGSFNAVVAPGTIELINVFGLTATEQAQKRLSAIIPVCRC
jgi:hypothetical protein